MRRVLALAVAALLALAPACGGDKDALVVSAASSLTEAFRDLAEAFEAQHPDVEVRLNTGASSALAAQIVEGAPAHVFASADQEQMAPVLAAGLAVSPRVFATNRLVVAVPVGGDIATFEDIAGPGVRLVLAGPEVPAGDYARRAIEAAEASMPGFTEAVLANVVSEEANVRAVLAKVELGEADAGFVYATDVAATDGAVRAIEVPSEYAPAVQYPIAALEAAPPLAEAFVAFVVSEEGQAILARHGFGGAE